MKDYVIRKIKGKKDKINLNKNFWVFTGSTVGVVPIKKSLLLTAAISYFTN